MKAAIYCLRFFLLNVILALSSVVLVWWWLMQRPADSLLDALHQRGALRVAIVNSAVSYEANDAGRSGFDYDLATRFAAYLGLDLQLRLVNSRREAVTLLQRGRVELVAASLVDNEHPPFGVRYGPTYMATSEVLVTTPKRFRREEQPPQYLLGEPYATDTLYQWSDQQVQWRVLEVPVEQALKDLNQGESDARLVLFSHEFDRLRSYFPSVVELSRTPPARALAWAVRQSNDHSLAQALGDFFQQEQDSDRLQANIQHYFNAFSEFDYAALQLYSKRIRSRLPKFKHYFELAAEDTGIDWRLIAAVAHQESHWRAEAVSPTGVKGLMMLTLPTAKEQNVTDRFDPEASTLGGARHLKKMLQRLPKGIPPRERTAFALAAYNVGLGHLYDARAITRQQGANPDLWSDVRQRLPLLEQKQWYSKAKYGRARGSEPVKYVANVLLYYDILVWLDKHNAKPSSESLAAPPRSTGPWLFDSLAPPKL